MTARERILTVLLGIVGIIAAGAIALAANAISGEEIGLSAQPVSLATDSGRAPKPAPGFEDREDKEEDDTATETVEDNSGPGGGDDSPEPRDDRDAREVDTDKSGSSNSGSGSSGSGKSGSGSSGSGSSGSGGDDPPEPPD